MAKARPSTVPITRLPSVTYARGGMAMRAGDGRIIGGLGVSGAPGGNFDEECGNAALDKIKEQLKYEQPLPQSSEKRKGHPGNGVPFPIQNPNNVQSGCV